MLYSDPINTRQNMLVQSRTAGQPCFWVRRIPIWNDVILAPMDGYSDLPFRLLCRELGSAMSYTEFVNVDSLQSTKGNAIALRKLEYEPSERPITFQIYGSDETRLVETAVRLQERGPDIVDINMGCYVRDIASRGAGSGMLRDPEKIGRIFKRLSKELTIPVTAKIRLGWDQQTRNHVTVARILEENGASLVAVHARTKEQGYTGSADWDAIAEVKQAVKIPVIGNGDVRTVEDIERIRMHTRCDGVMIGRAAMGNPWIFARKDRNAVSLAEKTSLMRRHLARNLDFYGPRLGLILFRKHAIRYIHDVPGAAALRAGVLRCETLAEFEAWVGAMDADPAR